MRAVLQHDASPGLRERIAATAPPWLEVAVVPEADTETFAREMDRAEILLHVLEQVTSEVVAAAPRLRLIQKIGVGVNTIDLDAARGRAVAVCNMPGTNSRAVAEMALALMLAALRRVAWLDSSVRRARTVGPETFDRVGEVSGRTVGLVGYGEVARILAPTLAAMGARCLYTATAPKKDAAAVWRALPELLAEADIVSLHLPLTPETRNLIDADAIARMKPGAVLVNTARGALVDEAALADALASGHLTAAGLDVTRTEPAPADSPLLALPNVVVTPHIAWLTPETLDRSLHVAFENCRRLRDGEDLLWRVA